MNLIDARYINETLKIRSATAHKGDFGKVLIYAGSCGMAGAAILCGSAALRTGSGLVKFLITDSRRSLQPIFQSVLYEATCVKYDLADDSPALENSPKQQGFAEYDSIACGCGLGKTSEAAAVLKQILVGYDKTLVLDADALNIISENEDLAEKVCTSSVTIIMTPHVGEAKRLLGDCYLNGAPASSFNFVSDEGRTAAALAISKKYNCICVLKGHETLVACSKKSLDKKVAGEQLAASCDLVFKNTTGNPGMATGGAGDVLCGVIASLAGQGYSPIDSACMGVFLHGEAGDIAAEKLGEMSVISRDILDNLPYAIKNHYKH